MNGNGTLEKRGDIWLARWVVNGKRFTRSTECKVSGGKKAKKEAEKKLKEFTLEFRTKDEKLIIEISRVCPPLSTRMPTSSIFQNSTSARKAARRTETPPS